MKKYCLKYANNDNYVKFFENKNGKVGFSSCPKQEAALYNLLSEAEQKKRDMEYSYKKLELNEKFVIEEVEVKVL